MSDTPTPTTDTPPPAPDTPAPAPEGPSAVDDAAEMFPRAVVEDLRKENAARRVEAQKWEAFKDVDQPNVEAFAEAARLLQAGDYEGVVEWMDQSKAQLLPDAVNDAPAPTNQGGLAMPDGEPPITRAELATAMQEVLTERDAQHHQDTVKTEVRQALKTLGYSENDVLVPSLARAAAEIGRGNSSLSTGEVFEEADRQVREALGLPSRTDNQTTTTEESPGATPSHVPPPGGVAAGASDDGGPKNPQEQRGRAYRSQRQAQITEMVKAKFDMS